MRTVRLGEREGESERERARGRAREREQEGEGERESDIEKQEDKSGGWTCSYGQLNSVSAADSS